MFVSISEVKDFLEKARSVFGGDSTKWIQGASARAADGELVAAWESRAVCWCLYGAMMKTRFPEFSDISTYNDGTDLVFVYGMSLMDGCVGTAASGIIEYNDLGDTTFEDIDQLLLAGIAECDARMANGGRRRSGLDD